MIYYHYFEIIVPESIKQPYRRSVAFVDQSREFKKVWFRVELETFVVTSIRPFYSSDICNIPQLESGPGIFSKYLNIIFSYAGKI